MVCIFGCQEDEPEFPFPKYERNPSMFMAWVRVLKGCINNNNLKNIKCYEDLRVCGKHFSTQDRVIINNVHHLLHTATPQHFLFCKVYSPDEKVSQSKVQVNKNIIGSKLLLKNGSSAAIKVNEEGIVHLDPKDLETGVYLKVEPPTVVKREKPTAIKHQGEGKTYRITSVDALRKMLKAKVPGTAASNFKISEMKIEENVPKAVCETTINTEVEPPISQPMGNPSSNLDLKVCTKKLITYGKAPCPRGKPSIINDQIIKEANMQSLHCSIKPQNNQLNNHDYFNKKPVNEKTLSQKPNITDNQGYTPYNQLNGNTIPLPKSPTSINKSPAENVNYQTRIDISNVVKTNDQTRSAYPAELETYETTLKQFKRLTRTYRNLQKKKQLLTKEIKMRKHAKQALRKVLSNLTPAAKMFTIMQMAQNGCTRGRRFNNFEKMFSLALLETNMRAYKLFANYFAMPCIKTLKKEGLKYEFNSPEFYEEMFKMELEKEAWEEVFVDKIVCPVPVPESRETDISNQEATEIPNLGETELLNKEGIALLNQEETDVLIQKETEVPNLQVTEVLNQEELLSQHEIGLPNKEEREVFYNEDTEMVYQQDKPEVPFKNVVTEVLYRQGMEVVYQDYTDILNVEGTEVFYQEDADNQEVTDIVNQDYIETVDDVGTEVVYLEDVEVVNHEQEVVTQEETGGNGQMAEDQCTEQSSSEWQLDDYKVQSGPNTFVIVEPSASGSSDVDDINRDMTPKELFGLHNFNLST